MAPLFHVAFYYRPTTIAFFTLYSKDPERTFPVHAHTLRFIVQTYLSVGYINYKIELKCCRASEKSCNKNEAFSIYEASDLQFICLFFWQWQSAVDTTPGYEVYRERREKGKGSGSWIEKLSTWKR